MRYPISIVANLITWPSMAAGMALGLGAGAIVAIGIGLMIARVTR